LKDITTDDALGVLKPMWLTKSRTARGNPWPD
jgi:hypothetical protein